MQNHSKTPVQHAELISNSEVLYEFNFLFINEIPVVMQHFDNISPTLIQTQR